MHEFYMGTHMQKTTNKLKLICRTQTRMPSQADTKLNVGTGATTTNASNAIELNMQLNKAYYRELSHHQPASNSIDLNVGTGPTKKH